MKRVAVLPEFPVNNAGLQRGTILEAAHSSVYQLGLSVGDRIPIGFDGEYIRCGPFTWSIEQIVDEIVRGIWKIAGTLDLSDSQRSTMFANDIERLVVEG